MKLINGPYHGGSIDLLKGDNQHVMITEYKSGDENEHAVMAVYTVTGDVLLFNGEGSQNANAIEEPTL